jgi:hypothetical protein
MISQPDLFTRDRSANEIDVDRLRGYLSFQKTFCTRKEICESLGWTERHLREVAEQLGSDILRCQAGFKLTADVTRDDASFALQAIDASISQGKRMIRYALALRKRLHSLIG